MRVRFWGTRGSIAQSRPQVLRYGGNTSCIELRSDDGALVVLDCGSGGYALGRSILADTTAPARAAMLFTHTHWDHIQGLPFFAPLFVPEREWDIYGPQGLNSSLRDTLAGQMQYDYFPITLEAMGARVRYHDLVEGEFEIDGINIRTHYLDHPALTLGYRLEADGVALVYACDHEPISRNPVPGESELALQERDHIAFLEDADMVIHDAQFTREEYPARLGWGHSTPDYAIAVAHAAGVRQLVLTHHDPARDDDALDDMLARARREARERGCDLAISAAQEGEWLDVGPAASSPKTRPDRPSPTPLPPPAMRDARVAPRLLLGPVRGSAAEVMSAAAEAESIALIRIADMGDLRSAMAGDGVSRLVVDSREPSAAAFLRAADAASITLPPLVMITDATAGTGMDGVAVRDWMTWPFSPQYAQTAMRCWVLRDRFSWVPGAIPAGEAQRLQALQRLNILDTGQEERFDRLTRMTARALELPYALITFIDCDRQWIKSAAGTSIQQTSRERAFCGHTIHQNRLLVVTDTLQDPRFADNPAVTGAPHIRFYAGHPLRSPDGYAIGSLCVIGVRPQVLPEAKRAMLRDFAALVEAELAHSPDRTRSAQALR